MAGTKMDGKETGGLMKAELGTLLSQLAWPDGWRGEGRERGEKKTRGRPAKPLEGWASC